MAPTGQMETQAPHPVQVLPSTTTWATPPGASAKRMADRSQASWQLRQVIPCADRQEAPAAATAFHGLPPVSPNTGAGQAPAQAPQNVQAPFWKSISGKPPSPAPKMPSGQASPHFPQRTHREVKLFWSDHGGRMADREGRARPRSRLLRRISTVSRVMERHRSAIRRPAVREDP